MRTTKHTPGPWEWDKDYYNLTAENGKRLIVGEDGSQDMRFIGPSFEDARLIAAAPDLLDACLGMLDTLAAWNVPWEALTPAQRARVASMKKAVIVTMKKAVKKALGESL